jgi:hypothetical protein
MVDEWSWSSERDRDCDETFVRGRRSGITRKVKGRDAAGASGISGTCRPREGDRQVR